MISATVKVDLSALDRFRAAVEQDLRGSGNGPVRAAIRKWGKIYRGFAKERFDRLSKSGGGGEWPPLKLSTMRGRRKARKGHGSNKANPTAARKFSLLRDTGLLFGALEPVWSNKPGALQEDIQFGVQVGYGGPGRHVKKKARATKDVNRVAGGVRISLKGSVTTESLSSATIADIARFHQTGAGNLPERKLIVNPDDATLHLMATEMERALKKMGRQFGVDPT